MSEMLGNQYFLARNYSRSASELYKALKSDVRSKPIRRKLVICYTQIDEIGKALDTFISLIKEDVDFVIIQIPFLMIVHARSLFTIWNRNWITVKNLSILT